MSQQLFVDNLMQQNNKLMTDLNNFNIQYAKYINCQKNNLPSTNCSSTDPTCCSVENKQNINLSTLTVSQNIIQNDINDIKTTLNQNKSLFLNPSQYDSRFNELIEKEKGVNDLRNELDIKIQELNQGKKFTENKLQSDSAIYSGIVFTILATTILYYTFTKL